jgi:hypothetical protein
VTACSTMYRKVIRKAGKGAESPEFLQLFGPLLHDS